ncbi:MAG: hypothetical protein APF76_15720 [Desulfitibacter sp. BRH_c19]|nr:MAG: hypothetical protein APF76_15720 [Desulfitibacter sp. BRH_c19]
MIDNTNVIIHPRCLGKRRDLKVAPPSKNKKRHINKVILTLVVLILGLVLFAFARFAWVSYQLDKEINEYLIQIEEAKMVNAQLVEEIKLAQDPAFIEKLARERLGLVKEGERVVMPAKPGDVMPFKQIKEGEIQH